MSSFGLIEGTILHFYFLWLEYLNFTWIMDFFFILIFTSNNNFIERKEIFYAQSVYAKYFQRIQTPIFTKEERVHQQNLKQFANIQNLFGTTQTILSENQISIPKQQTHYYMLNCNSPPIQPALNNEGQNSMQRSFSVYKTNLTPTFFP